MKKGKLKFDKDGWSENPLELIKQLKKEMSLYFQAGGKPTKKMIKQINKTDKILKDTMIEMDKKCQKK